MCKSSLLHKSTTKPAASQQTSAVSRAGFDTLEDFYKSSLAAALAGSAYDMSRLAGHKPGYYKRQKGYQLDFVQVVEELQRRHPDGLPYADSKYERNKTCSDQLVFTVGGHSERATLSLAFRCGLPLCPCCEASRSHKRLMELTEALEVIQAVRAADGLPPLVVLMLTETLPNCSGADLPDYIDLLFRAHDKLMHYKAVSSVVLGSARSFEITHNREDDYHPHLHTLLLVEPSYFNNKTASRGYLSQAAWANLHYKAVKACCKKSSVAWSDIQQPEGQTFSVNIKRAYKKGADASASLLDSMTDAGKEASKYVCKPDELMRYRSDKTLDMDWCCDAVYTVSSAIHGRRRYTSSGLWREALAALGYSADTDPDDEVGQVVTLSREEREPDASGLSFAVVQQTFYADLKDYVVSSAAATENPDDTGVFLGTKLWPMIEHNLTKRAKRAQCMAAAAARLSNDWTTSGPADGWTAADTKDYFPEG